MRNSSSDLKHILEHIQKELEKTKKNAEHLTLTLNDIYDTFLRLGLKIERNEHNTEHIIKLLKDISCKKIDIDEFVIKILKELILPHINAK